jgi:hypothetical protein
MIRSLLSFISRMLVKRAVATGAQNVAAQATGGRLNLKVGLRLLRDRRVPVGVKLAALALGAAVAGAFQFAEVPLETVLLFVMPLLGLADIAFDGLEIFGLVLGVACAVLPFIAPEELVAKHRREADGRVYEAVGASVKR